MTELQERLERLRKRFLEGYSGDEGLRELNAISTALADGNYQAKIREAIGWYEIYASPHRSDKFAGGHAGVKSFFLAELGSAIDIAAGRLKGSE